MKTSLNDAMEYIAKPFVGEVTAEKITEICRQIATKIANDLIDKFEIKKVIAKQIKNSIKGEIAVTYIIKKTK